MNKTFGFTLAELLIALAILGVIATFTIPKVLQSQADSKYKAIAKETAAAVSQAYQNYRQNGNTGVLELNDLSPYLNYVSIRTTGLIDDYYGTGTNNCSNTRRCFILHNGGVVYNSSTMGGTASTSAMWFEVDPDGQSSSTTNGPGKSIMFWLYYSGRLKTYSTIDPNTCDSGWCTSADANADPPWFNWN
jgi:prepilin-type N-terminal cleavage/methylation domain-containing protein